MADTKTSALTTLAVADMAADYIPILDTSTATLKRITPDDLLDSEAGTWNGVLSDGVNNAVMALNTGYYEKHGREVKVRIDISTSSKGSISGALRITGLPFVAAAATGSAITCGYGTGLSITAGHDIGGYVAGGSAFILLNIWSATTGIGSFTDANWGATGRIMLAASYHI